MVKFLDSTMTLPKPAKNSYEKFIYTYILTKSRQSTLAQDQRYVLNLQAIMTFKPVGAEKKPVQDQERCPSPEMITSDFKQERIVRSRRLTFKDFVHIRPTLHISDYTAHEMTSTWYSRKEMQHFKNDVSATAFHVRTGAYVRDDDYYCCRGIEVFCFREFALNRKGNKILGLKTVLDEQGRQEYLQILDPEALRSGHQQAVGIRCAHEARRRGESDAANVDWQLHKGNSGDINSPLERLREKAAAVPAQ